MKNVNTWLEIIENIGQENIGGTYDFKLVIVNCSSVLASSLITTTKLDYNDYLLSFTGKKHNIAGFKDAMSRYAFSDKYRIDTRYPEKALQMSSDEAFMHLSQVLNTKVDAYALTRNLVEAPDIGKYSEQLDALGVKYGISKLRYGMDFMKGIIEVESLDFILANTYLDEYAEIIGVDKDSIRTKIRERAVGGQIDIAGYYLRHFGKATGKYARVQAIKDTLHEIIPIAVKFGSDSTNMFYDLLTNKDVKIIENPYVSQEEFDAFRDSIFIEESPSNRMSQDVNMILYTTKEAFSEMSKIECSRYSFEVGAFILQSLTMENFANLQYGSAEWLATLRVFAMRSIKNAVCKKL